MSCASSPPGLVLLGVPAGLRHLLLRGLAHPVQLRPSRFGRLPRLGQLRLGLPGAGLKPGPGLLGRRELRLEPGLVLLGVPAGLRHLLLRGLAHPVQLRPSRLGRLPRPRRVLPGLGGPGLGLGHPRLGPGRPGLRAAHRLVPLLPRRGHLLPRGPRLLLGGGLRRQRLG